MMEDEDDDDDEDYGVVVGDNNNNNDRNHRVRIFTSKLCLIFFSCLKYFKENSYVIDYIFMIFNVMRVYFLSTYIW